MIESVRGTVEGTAESCILVRTGPVVLRVLAPGYFLRSVVPGREVELPVYLHLQMEGNRIVPLIVGFSDERAREFFERFISVSGVGVRAAVRALEQPPDRIASAIACGDCDYLTGLPGIGMKRARQIVAGLQEQMRSMYEGEISPAGDTGARAEAMAVLRQLGVPLSEASVLVDGALDELDGEAATSDIVKRAMNIRSRK